MLRDHFVLILLHLDIIRCNLPFFFSAQPSSENPFACLHWNLRIKTVESNKKNTKKLTTKSNYGFDLNSSGVWSLLRPTERIFRNQNNSLPLPWAFGLIPILFSFCWSKDFKTLTQCEIKQPSSLPLVFLNDHSHGNYLAMAGYLLNLTHVLCYLQEVAASPVIFSAWGKR